jgi:hypothetical protein
VGGDRVRRAAGLRQDPERRRGRRGGAGDAARRRAIENDRDEAVVTDQVSLRRSTQKWWREWARDVKLLA